MAVAVLKLVHTWLLVELFLYMQQSIYQTSYFENYNVRAMLVLLLHRSSHTGLR